MEDTENKEERHERAKDEPYSRGEMHSVSNYGFMLAAFLCVFIVEWWRSDAG